MLGCKSLSHFWASHYMTAHQRDLQGHLETQHSLWNTIGEERTEKLAGFCLSCRRKCIIWSGRNHPSSRAVNLQEYLFLPLLGAPPMAHSLPLTWGCKRRPIKADCLPESPSSLPFWQPPECAWGPALGTETWLFQVLPAIPLLPGKYSLSRLPFSWKQTDTRRNLVFQGKFLL